MQAGIFLGRPIAFYAELARELGGIEEAIFYQQIHYWGQRGKRDDGFVYKTVEELEEETTLSRYQQDRIRKKLIKKGWLEVKLFKANGAPTLHYRPLVSVEMVLSRFVRNSQMDLRETDKSEMRETDKSICMELANPITEITTETTQRSLHSAPTGAVTITIGHETHLV